jgi:hypothetical protein
MHSIVLSTSLAGSSPAKATDFKGDKNQLHAFLRRESKDEGRIRKIFWRVKSHFEG